MIVHDVAQRSEEWEQLRLGIPTASEFSRIICSSAGKEFTCQCGMTYTRKRKRCECGGDLTENVVAKLSTQAEGYINRLLAEWYYGAPLEDPQSQYQSQWMERGSDMEVIAVRAYEFMSGLKTQKVGFVTLDSGLIGCSPDRFVGDEGGLEVKCPSPAVHMGYMRTRKLESDYYQQIQGCMLICERKWWDVISYCPPFPEVIIRCNRDEEYLSLMQSALLEFMQTLGDARRLIERNYPRGETPKPVVADSLGVTDADVEAILAQRSANG